MQPLTLTEGTKVDIVIVVKVAAKQTPQEILARIAALPLEVEREVENAGREHDQYLYGKQDEGESR